MCSFFLYSLFCLCRWLHLTGPVLPPNVWREVVLEQVTADLPQLLLVGLISVTSRDEVRKYNIIQPCAWVGLKVISLACPRKQVHLEFTSIEGERYSYTLSCHRHLYKILNFLLQVCYGALTSFVNVTLHVVLKLRRRNAHTHALAENTGSKVFTNYVPPLSL